MAKHSNGFVSCVPNLWTFDKWASANLKLASPYQMPVIRKVPRIPVEFDLIPFDKRLQSSNPGSQVVHFYIEDFRFRSVMVNPVKYMSSLSDFVSVIGPDVSPYASHSSYMRASSIWYGKAITAFWQQHGLSVVPNVRWMHDEDIQYALCGLPEESVLAVSTLGVIATSEGRACFRRGLKLLVEQKRPATLLVHGQNREDIFGEVQGKTNIEFFQPRFYAAHSSGSSHNG